MLKNHKETNNTSPKVQNILNQIPNDNLLFIYNKDDKTQNLSTKNQILPKEKLLDVKLIKPLTKHEIKQIFKEVIKQHDDFSFNDKINQTIFMQNKNT